MLEVTAGDHIIEELGWNGRQSIKLTTTRSQKTDRGKQRSPSRKAELELRIVWVQHIQTEEWRLTETSLGFQTGSQASQTAKFTAPIACAGERLGSGSGYVYRRLQCAQLQPYWEHCNPQKLHTFNLQDALAAARGEETKRIHFVESGRIEDQVVWSEVHHPRLPGEPQHRRSRTHDWRLQRVREAEAVQSAEVLVLRVIQGEANLLVLREQWQKLFLKKLQMSTQNVQNLCHQNTSTS